MQIEASIRNKLESRRNFCIQLIQKIESKHVTKRDYVQSVSFHKGRDFKHLAPASMNYIIRRAKKAFT